MRLRFPEAGQETAKVVDQLEAMKTGDADWQGGRVPLFVFKGSDAATEISRQAFDLYFAENALGRARAFTSLQRMEDEIVAMALDLFHAPDDAAGFVTTGGSESIIQAMQTCRDYNRAVRQNDRHRGNIVIPASGHPAFDKGARLMDLEVRRIPVSGDYTGDVAAMEAAIDQDTIMLVGSAPCFPFGVFDPIEELSEMALRRGVWLHVDACVGGYLAPFVAASGRAIPPFDLAIEGVCSMSADLHKFGYAPKPISTVFYRSCDHARYHGFEFHDWPNGRFATTTIVGTRAGGAIAGAWALFQHLGRMDRNVRTRQPGALFMRTSIDRIVDKVGTDAAIVQQGIALGWCAVTDDRLASRFCFNQEAKQGAFDLVDLGGKSLIGLKRLQPSLLFD